MWDAPRFGDVTENTESEGPTRKFGGEGSTMFVTFVFG